MSTPKAPVPELDDEELAPTGPFKTARMRAPPDLFAGDDAVRLLVLGRGAPQTFALKEGRSLIGRAKDAEVRVDDESISRRHAVLDIGRRVTIEDLGSLNGTRARERTIAKGERVEIAFGEAFEVGHVIAIVQRRGAADPPRRRLWPHGYFEARVEEECERRQHVGGTFTIVRFHVDEGANDDVVHGALDAALRTGDVAGSYGPGELEVLFLDAPWDDVEAACERFVRDVRAAGADVHTGIATYPTDGRNAAELLEKANVEASGVVPEEVAPRPSHGAMERLKRLIDRVAKSDLSVVLQGETGVGKEVLARELHRLSDRAEARFVGLNCASLSDTLLESELFGHERGAFTGAVTMKPGLFEVAEKGTVFLDEIAEMPHPIQAKLLRVLEERTVLRVGGLHPRAIDVRFIAASHRDLEVEVMEGRFRQDLFFRLNGMTLAIPALRERVDEIEELAVQFVADASKRMRRPEAPVLSKQSMQLLLAYAWPGNIRELKNVMERAVLLCTGNAILPEHLPVEKMRAPPPRPLVERRRAQSPFAEAHPSQPMAAAPAPPPVALPAPVALPPPPVGAAPTPAARPADFDDATMPWSVPGGGLAGPVSSSSGSIVRPPGIGDGDLRLDQAVQDVERDRILEALRRSGGNQTKAAELLGISRRTLINRLDAYKIPRPRKP